MDKSNRASCNITRKRMHREQSHQEAPDAAVAAEPSAAGGQVRIARTDEEDMADARLALSIPRLRDVLSSP
jgi:hypothetical protein